MESVFKFDEEKLVFVEINKSKRKRNLRLYVLMSVTVILLTSSLILKNTKEIIKHEREILIVIAQQDTFSDIKFVDMLKGLNLKFPHVAYAQGYLESGIFDSPIFHENHNIFGNRHPVIRVTTSLGSRSGYAYYKDWRMSVIDYGLYNATYLWRLPDEEAYLEYLGKYYAEDTVYIPKLRGIIKANKYKFE